MPCRLRSAWGIPLRKPAKPAILPPLGTQRPRSLPTPYEALFRTMPESGAAVPGRASPLPRSFEKRPRPRLGQTIVFRPFTNEHHTCKRSSNVVCGTTCQLARWLTRWVTGTAGTPKGWDGMTGAYCPASINLCSVHSGSCQVRVGLPSQYLLSNNTTTLPQSNKPFICCCLQAQRYLQPCGKTTQSLISSSTQLLLTKAADLPESSAASGCYTQSKHSFRAAQKHHPLLRGRLQCQRCLNS